MITIFGMTTCPDCEAVKKQIEGSQDFEYIDISKHVKNLKAFLKVRDNSPVFDDAKANGFAGIPCFVKEDGSVTLVPEEVGLKSRVEDAEMAVGTACRLDGTGC